LAMRSATQADRAARNLTNRQQPATSAVRVHRTTMLDNRRYSRYWEWLHLNMQLTVIHSNMVASPHKAVGSSKDQLLLSCSGAAAARKYWQYRQVPCNCRCKYHCCCWMIWCCVPGAHHCCLPAWAAGVQQKLVSRTK
jgi:hypothetical protein